MGSSPSKPKAQAATTSTSNSQQTSASTSTSQQTSTSTSTSQQTSTSTRNSQQTSTSTSKSQQTNTSTSNAEQTSTSTSNAEQTSTNNTQQTPAGCGLCKTGMKVTSKCFQCDLLLCENCSHQHLRKENNREHEVVYIKDIGTMIDITNVKTFTTDLSYIDCVLPDQDNKIWIGCRRDRKIYHIQLQDNDMTIINRINMDVRDMARLSQNKILLSVSKPTLKLLDTDTLEVSDSIFTVPFGSSCVHVTEMQQVFIGAGADVLGNVSMVVVLNIVGETVATFATTPPPFFGSIFNGPHRVTVSSCIHVVDLNFPRDGTGRVVVLNGSGRVINMYSGHPDINIKYPFRPSDIVTTPAGSGVIVSDHPSYALHILDRTGQLVTFIDTKDKGIFGPRSLAFMDDGHLLIGCYSEGRKNAKLHKVKVSGI